MKKKTLFRRAKRYKKGNLKVKQRGKFYEHFMLILYFFS